jgi:YD repeat-containing protein
MRGARNLQRQLRRLVQRYGVRHSAPTHVPLAPPPDHDASLILEGMGSSPTLDCDRTRFAAFCFGASLPATLPLFIEHDTERQVGTVTLSYDAQGALRARTSPLTGDARRYNAFSISAKIIQYGIHDADHRSFFAEVTQAELTEVSLTTHPHLDTARVLQRLRPNPQAEFYNQAQRGFEIIGRKLALIHSQMEVRR